MNFMSAKWPVLSLVFTAAYYLAAVDAHANLIVGAATRVEELNSDEGDYGVAISGDGLEFYFHSNRDPGFSDPYDHQHIFVATRDSTADSWGAPQALLELINLGGAGHPSLSSDGLTMYFNSRPALSRPGNVGARDIWMTTRADTEDSWTAPVNLGEAVNSTSSERHPAISPDGLELYFASDRSQGVNDIYVSTRTSTSDAWTAAQELGVGVNSSSHDLAPSLSPDGLALFFYSSREETFDLFVSTRQSAADAWGDPVRLDDVINEYWEVDPYISADGETMYFARSMAEGSLSAIIDGFEIWQAPIDLSALYNNTEPTGDFNRDGIVDGSDFLLWQRGESTNPFSSTDLASWEDGFASPGSAKVSSRVAELDAHILCMIALVVCARTPLRRLARSLHSRD